MPAVNDGEFHSIVKTIVGYQAISYLPLQFFAGLPKAKVLGEHLYIPPMIAPRSMVITRLTSQFSDGTENIMCRKLVAKPSSLHVATALHPFSL
jgi:hypothetical protein